MTPDNLNSFYSKISFAGLLILYGVKLSIDKKIAFDRDHFAKEIKIGSSDYFYGFLIACASFDIVRFNTKEKVITATYLDPSINQTIVEKAAKMSASEERWKTYLDGVTNYFK